MPERDVWLGKRTQFVNRYGFSVRFSRRWARITVRSKQLVLKSMCFEYVKKKRFFVMAIYWHHVIVNKTPLKVFATLFYFQYLVFAFLTNKSYWTRERAVRNRMSDDQTVNILNLRRGLLSAILNEFCDEMVQVVNDCQPWKEYLRLPGWYEKKRQVIFQLGWCKNINSAKHVSFLPNRSFWYLAF